MEALGRIATTLIRVKNITHDPYFTFWIAARNCYYKENLDSLVDNYTPEKGTTLFKKIIDIGHLSCLEHINFQITMEGVSRSFMAQITRHRHAVFHISSQHFQNHSDFLFVMPKFTQKVNEAIFLAEMDIINDSYKNIIANGDPHYIARQILPNAAACKIVMTVNLRELRLIIKLRQGKENTPETRDVIKMIINAVNHQDPTLLYGLDINGGE